MGSLRSRVARHAQHAQRVEGLPTAIGPSSSHQQAQCVVGALVTEPSSAASERADDRAASDRLRIGLESFAEDVSTGQVADRRFL